jgi:hypothetical protein
VDVANFRRKLCEMQMFQSLKRIAAGIRTVALVAAVLAISPVAPTGLGLLSAAEADSEQAPGESESVPSEAALSLSENGLDLQQRRHRRGVHAQPAGLATAESHHRRSIDQAPHSNSECECFSLPLRC